MLLIHCEINVILISAIFPAIGGTTFAITYKKCSVPAETLSTQDNSKL